MHIIGAMNTVARYSVALPLLMLALATLPGCSTTGSAPGEIEPPVIEPVQALPAQEPAPAPEAASKQEEGEVPLAVAASEKPETAPPEVVVQGPRSRNEKI